LLARVLSATVWGVDARLVEVEVDVASGRKDSWEMDPDPRLPLTSIE